MQTWYIVFVSLLVGSGMILVGFKIHKPKFVSGEAEEKFYKNFTKLFQAGGIAMLIWGFINLYRIVKG